MSQGIDNQLSIDALQHRARREAARLNELRQVAKRMYELLPHTLKQLRRQQHSGRKVAHAERLALTHSDYQAAIEQYLDVLTQSIQARVAYDTHKMMFQARQSLRRYHLDTKWQDMR